MATSPNVISVTSRHNKRAAPRESGSGEFTKTVYLAGFKRATRARIEQLINARTPRANLGYARGDTAMPIEFKRRLRKRLLGTETRQQIDDDTACIARLGNQPYLAHPAALRVPGFEPPFAAYEFSAYSQNGEDGLILHLLSRIGVEQRFIAEVGTEDGRECNSANLILNYGWRACLIEMNRPNAERCREHFQTLTQDSRVRVLNAAATPENIEDLLNSGAVPVALDVLSIDIDSHDYWLWQSVHAFTPRLVVIEYNAVFGPQARVTVPYPMPSARHRYYHGASLAAVTALAGEKGYQLMGCDSCGVNAFFVRNDLADAAGLPGVAVADAFRPHRRRSRKHSPAQQWALIENAPLVTV